MKRILLLLMCILITFSGCAQKLEDNKSDTDEVLPTGKVDKPIEGEITISLLDEIEFVNIAAEMFMEKYPNTNIIVETFRETEYIETENGSVMSVAPSEEFSTENYLKQLNTKIMSGKAADVISTDPLPMIKYSEMGVFEDLTPYIREKGMDDENYFMNIINLGKGKKGQFEIPLRVFFDVVSFDKELVEDSGIKPDENLKAMSFSDALDIGIRLVDNTNRDNTYLSIGRAPEVAYQLVRESIHDFIDFDKKEANFDSKEFTDILEYAKKLDDEGYFDKGTIDFYNMEYHFAYDIDFPNQAAAFTLYNDSIRYQSMPICNKDGRTIGRMSYTFGINSQSKNKDLAWEFIYFLMSEEVQSMPSFYMTGINKNAFDAASERYAKMMISDEYNFEISDYTKLLRGWYEQVEVNEFKDYNLSGIIYEEMDKYFKDIATAEETGKNIQRRVDKYFNE